MKRIKLLKLKIKDCNTLLDQKRAAYYQSKKVMNQDNKFTAHLLYFGALSSVFIWFLGDKFRKQLFKASKNIAKIGLKRIIT